MWIGMRLVSVYEITLVLLASALLSGCFLLAPTESVTIREGSLVLNQRLRFDMGPSAGMPDGRFFADGQCGGLPATDTDCRFVTQVRGSLISPAFTHRLRKSEFLWVAGGNGFPQLSYELIGDGLSIVQRDDPSTVFFHDITIGTCTLFPGYDPETRKWILDQVSIPPDVSREFVQQFDVVVRSCHALPMSAGVSEELKPIETNCGTNSVRDRLAPNFPPSPENAPFCVRNLGLGALMSDVSFSVTPGAASQVNIADLWPKLNAGPLTLLPHLKTVPIDGKRTISRELKADGQGDDGLFYYRWKVDVISELEAVFKDRWSENFSPNIFVTRARVRHGPWVSNGTNYLPIQSLKVGASGCQFRVPGSNDTEFDIPMCQIGSTLFRVTPAYLFDAISKQRVDDSDILPWRVGISPAHVAGGVKLFLELDLVVDSSAIGTMGSGLLAQPGSRDLGSIRKGQTPAPQPGFILRNYGAASVWIESIAFEGYDAAEFGTPLISRAVPLTTSVTATATPPPISAPLVLLAGSAVEIKVQPAFQSTGDKRTEVVVRHHDIRNTPQSISMPVLARSVSAVISMLPEDVRFVATPGFGPFGAAQAVRAVAIENSGTADFQRTGVSISGPQASSFHVLSGHIGSTPSDLSQPVSIVPGGSETYSIGFFPHVAGESRATLVISTSEGQVMANLSGGCAQRCQQKPYGALEEPKSLPPVTREPAHLELKFPPGTWDRISR